MSTERSETIPTAAERISEFLRRARAVSAGDQGAVAEVFTTLGMATRPSTVTRIETGKQAANLDQVLLLALFTTGSGPGLRGMLQVPFRVADVVIETDEDLDALLGYPGGDAWTRRGPTPTADELWAAGPEGIVATRWRKASNLTEDVLIDRRYRLIADQLGVEVGQVEKATHELYGGGIYHAINERTRERLSRDDPPAEFGSPTWQAYRSHAVRAVAKEIATHLGGRA